MTADAVVYGPVYTVTLVNDVNDVCLNLQF